MQTLPAAFPGGSHQLLAGQSGSCAEAGKLRGLQLSCSRQPSSTKKSPLSPQDGGPQPAMALHQRRRQHPAALGRVFSHFIACSCMR